MTDQQLTLQQITDRLAEEAGYVRVTFPGYHGDVVDGWDDKDGNIAIPPDPDSVDDAIKAVPAGTTWMLATLPDGTFKAIVGRHTATASHPAHALYFAAAKARGWM